MFLPLLLAIAQPEPSLMTCDQFDWLVEGTLETKSLSPSEKIYFVQSYARWTDPSCFGEEK
jgi:hypothetical protein